METSRKEWIKKKEKIIKKLFGNIIDRMDINTESNCFIIIIDHKENFLNHPEV